MSSTVSWPLGPVGKPFLAQGNKKLDHPETDY
jgi:hypothetical protein